jgi:hypothetical protein
MSNNPWVWIQAIGMIAIFSFIFAENPVYRFFEHLYVGAGAGYAISVNIKAIYDNALTPLTQEGKFVLIIPIMLGLMLYARFFKSISWLSRWSIAFLVGIGTGIAIYGGVNSQFVAQIRSAMFTAELPGQYHHGLRRTVDPLLLLLFHGA